MAKERFLKNCYYEISIKFIYVLQQNLYDDISSYQGATI